jgi:energy-coupling factor transport system permease protein
MSYLRRASPLHAARASVGAAYCGALVLAALVVSHPLVLGVLALAVLGAGIGAGVGGRVARSLYLSLPMAVAIVLVNALVSRGGLTVIARLGDAGPFGQLDITVEAVAYGAKAGLVLIVIVAGAALASACIDPDELLRSLRRVSFRSALTATIATRMVPLLALDARRIGEAQRCRPHPGGRLAVMRAITANVLDRSLDIAATLEVRGYGSARRPARVRRPWSRHDLAFAASAVALVVLALAVPAPFSFYPAIRGSAGASTLVLAGALAAAVLAPFAQRRGIVR